MSSWPQQSDQGLMDGVAELRRREVSGDNATPIPLLKGMASGNRTAPGAHQPDPG